MKPVCNFEMAELPGFGLQKPITMRVIACFHEQPPIDSFEKQENAVFPSAATIFDIGTAVSYLLVSLILH